MPRPSAGSALASACCLQANPVCIKEEYGALATRKGPTFSVSFVPQPTADALLLSSSKSKASPTLAC